MALTRLYTVRDIKSGSYTLPQGMLNDAVLRRSIEAAARSEDSQMNSHPEDFQVFYIGDYDSTTGEIRAVPPEHIFNVVDIVKEVQ